MSTDQNHAFIETLSESLLRLYQLSRGSTAPGFLEKAVNFLAQVIEFRCGWWGLRAQAMRSEGPSIYQAEYLELPDRDLDEWLQLTSENGFANEIVCNPGEGLHPSCGPVQGAYPQRVYELIEELHLHHAMGVCFDWKFTGQRFFITLFRGKDDERFSECEASLFLHLLKHALQIWHHKMLDALSGFSSTSCSELAIARKDGRIVYVGADMRALLAFTWADWNGISIPAGILKESGKFPTCQRLDGSVLNIFSSDDYIWLVNVKSGLGLGADRHVRHEYCVASTASAWRPTPDADIKQIETDFDRRSLYV